MRQLLPVLLCIAASTTAHGQEPSPSVAIAPIISRTLTPAALKRVVGERHFKDERGGLATITCSLDDPKRPSELRCVAEFQTVGAMREETLTLRCALGLDGRVRRSGFELVRGRDRVAAQGAIEGGKLQLTVREGRDERVQERAVTVPWTDDALPYSLAAFVAPLLDLPAGLKVRVFHPVNMAVNARRSTLRRAAGTFTLGDTYPNMDMVIRIRTGTIVEVRLGKAVRYEPITREQALELLIAPAPR